MIIVIIAGGSGTRLWPLSQPDYPKHLLRLTGETSLLQNTYLRSKALTDNIYVATEASHSREVQDQLPELDAEHFIIEPARRGTASVIVLVLAHLQRKHPEETVVFLHADHHIKDTESFASTVQAAAEAAQRKSKISLIGLVPTHPATGFGYIQAGKKVAAIHGLEVMQVEKFVEKPKFATAEKYLKAGNYFWNLGLFAAPISVFSRTMEQHAPDLHKAFMQLGAAKTNAESEQIYLGLANQPIDTALMEKTHDLLVIPGRFDWADIGSFFDLHKILAGRDTNALEGDVTQLDCTDSLIHASTKPIIAVGLEGVVVIDTPEGLLVASKEKSQKVGDVVKSFYQRLEDRP